MDNIIKFKNRDAAFRKNKIIYLHQESGFFDVNYSIKHQSSVLWFKQKILAWAVMSDLTISPVFLHNDEIYTYKKLKEISKIDFFGFYDNLNEERIAQLPSFKEDEIRNANKFYNESSALLRDLYVIENNGSHSAIVASSGQINVTEVDFWKISDDGLNIIPCVSENKGTIIRIEPMEVLGLISGIFSYEAATELKNILS